MRTLISLGQVCDVAFELRMHSGDNTAHFFDWLATPFDALIHILENDFEVFHPEHLILKRTKNSSFVHDEITNINFFHHFTIYGKTIPESFLLEYPNFIGKFQYLAARFRETIKTKPVTLVRQNITCTQAQRLEQVFFKCFPNSDVNFLYITPANEQFATQYGRSIVIEADKQKRGFGNIVTWAHALQTAKIITHAFRLSTVEVLAKDTAHYNFKGLAHINRHSKASLEIACKQAVHNPWFFYELALQCVAEKNWQQASDAINQAIKLDNNNAEFYRVQLKIKATCHEISDKQLAHALSELCHTEHNNLAIYHDLLTTLMKIADYKSALAIINKILVIEPLNTSIYFHKAHCLRELQHIKSAQLAIERAITINPDIAHYYTLKSELLMTENKLDEAIIIQQKAVALGGGFAVLFRYGNLLLQAKQFTEAIAAYDTANEHNPNHHALIQKKLQAERFLKAITL